MYAVGGRVRCIGQTSDETGSLGVPSTMLVDLIAAWEYGRSRFQLNGQNVGDQTYVSTRLSRGDRVVTGTLSYRF